nr:putative baseplate assembly protein [uncultured Desulfobacter sp.]
MSQNSSSGQSTLNHCQCCEGKSQKTPAAIDNRPGLSAIAYRIGSHAQFRQSMESKLSGADTPALSDLTTREKDDFSIALIDAWATVCDVLTFYQERIANESYLKTATERFSVRELGRLVGYSPSPGVAAETYLAFTVDEPAKLPESVTEYYPTLETGSSQGYQTPDRIAIAIGTKVQSVPGQDELPQTFETVEEIEARAEWNALKPQLIQTQVINFSTTSLYVKGTSLGLQVGDRILIVLGTGSLTMAQHRTITSVEPATTCNRTRIELSGAVSKKFQQLLPLKVRVYVLREQIGFFGNNAPHYASLIGTDGGKLYQNYEDWTIWDSPPLPDTHVQTIPKKILDALVQNSEDINIEYAESNIKKSKTTPFTITLPSALIPDELNQDSENITMWDAAPLLETSQTNPQIIPHEGAHVYLERIIQGVIPGSWVLLSTFKGESEIFQVAEVNQKSLVGFGMSARGTGLKLKTVQGEMVPARPDLDFKVRTTTAYLKSEELKLTDMPVSKTLLAKGATQLTLGQRVEGLRPGQPVALRGKLQDQAGVTGSEILFIEKITDEDLTTLTFKTGVAASYIYDTITLNANVAAATHGETVMEVLGSGDGSAINQSFLLRQPPLTYISSSTASGRASTLQVRVNDLLWQEVDTFFGRGPDEHIYVTRTNEDGTTTVQFSDGKTGARLPTGQENVRAQYRSGIGTAGNVKTGQLSQLMSRPLGLKEAYNPQAATGGDDSEALANARRNAPRHVLTLDRIVSFTDYEDFARSFAGIAKARATLAGGSPHQVVVITVSGPEGAEILPDQSTYKNLLQAMQDAGDPHVQVRLVSYRKAFFRVEGTVWCHPDYEPKKVQAALYPVLETTFGFTAREFGHPVRLSEIIAVIHSVPGVTAVDIDQFYRTDPGLVRTLRQRLPAATGSVKANGDILPGELLLLDTTALPSLYVAKSGTAVSSTPDFKGISQTISLPKITQRFTMSKIRYTL